jgi:fatty acid desaturase
MVLGVELPLYGVLRSWWGRSCNVFDFPASNSSARAFVESNQAAKQPLSRRKGNTLGWVVWALMSVMLVCLLLWAATGAVALLFAAVLAGLGVLYVVLLTNL